MNDYSHRKLDLLYPVQTAESHQISSPWVNNGGWFGDDVVQVRVTVTPQSLRIEEVARGKMTAWLQDANIFIRNIFKLDIPLYHVDVLGSWIIPKQTLTEDQEKLVIAILQNKDTIEFLETQIVYDETKGLENFAPIVHQIKKLLPQPKVEPISVEEQKKIDDEVAALLAEEENEDKIMKEKVSLIKSHLPNHLKFTDSRWLESKKEIVDLATDYYDEFINKSDILKEINKILEDEDFLKNPTLYLDKIKWADNDDDLEPTDNFDIPQNAAKELLQRFFPSKAAF